MSTNEERNYKKDIYNTVYFILSKTNNSKY